MITYSIIQKSQIENYRRIDAEYFQPAYLEAEKQLNSIETTTIDEISESVVNFGAYSLCNYITFQESGIPYLNVENIKNGYIDFEDVKFISDEINEILKKSKVKEGQVIITMAGTIGNAAVAYNISSKINSNQATAKISLKKDFSPFYLAAFLNSNYGRKQTEREIVSSVQPNIFLWQIKNFKIPIGPKHKEKEIEYIYRKGLDELEKSKSLYSQAEDLLLAELGLKEFKSKEELSYTVNLSNVKSAHRADAEYFQPKYDELIKRIAKNEHEKLIKLANRVKTKIKPIPDRLYKYIEISDIDISDGFVDFNEIIGQELPANARIQIKGLELVISKVRPTRGAISILPPDFNKDFICSSAFSVFTVLGTLKEYLFVVLRSIIGKIQFEKPTTGTSYPTITDQDVENILVPILPQSFQQKIADLVRQSHEARKKAKDLLEKAKREVEEFIERAQ